MTYVVSESCVACKYTDCVTPCPVDAFREGRNALVIDPEVCIDCALCVPECPVDAIAHEHQLPERQRAWIRLNRDLARQWPLIRRAQAALSGAADWAAVADKVGQLDRRPGGRGCDEAD